MSRVFSCFLFMTPTLVCAGVFTVGPAGTHASLQSAFDAAAGPGGDHEIRIQQGVFDNGTTSVFVNDDLSVHISGGWNAAFSEMTPNPSLTSLSGGMDSRVLSANALTGAGGTLRIENLTITAGFAERSGAGLSLVSTGTARVEIVNCHFLENKSGFDDGSTEGAFGAAIDANLNNESTLLINGCLFRGNISRGSSVAGAALGLSASQDTDLVVTNCHFMANEARAADNSAGGGGLDLFARNNSSAEISNNTFRDNVVECQNGNAAGGGLSAGASGEATFEITGNVFLRTP